MKFVLTLSVAGLAITSAFAQSLHYGIPRVTLKRTEWGLTYNVRRTETRSRADRDSLVERKRRQYDDLVSKGSVSRSSADQVLESMRSQPLEQESSRTVSFLMSEGKLLVLCKDASKPEADWAVLMGDYTVRKGWQGGDNITLSSEPEPYSFCITKLPVLPLQLPAINAFVDLQQDRDSIIGRMLTVSLGREDYFTCTLQFGVDGLLRSAEVPGIERWTYDNYSKETPPIPARITLERLYDKNGQPQVVDVYTRSKSSAKFKDFDDLIPAKSIAVVDRRSDPVRQFTYVKGNGSLLRQSRSGFPVYAQQLPERAKGFQLTFTGLLVGAGCLILAAISIIGLLKRRPSMRGR